MKLIDGHALAERLLSDAITTDQRRQANMIAKVIEEMPEYLIKQQLSSIYGKMLKADEGWDLITRQAAIDALGDEPTDWDAERMEGGA